MKKLLAILLSITLCVAMVAACAEEKVETVHLVVWGGEFDQVMLAEMIDAFVEAKADQVTLTYSLGVEGEGTAKDTVLNDIQAAADVFAFADDQIIELVNAGALQEVLLNTDEIISRNSAGSVASATVDGRLMAYPMTDDNGIFLFYNSAYLSADDVKTWDGLLAAAEKAGKKAIHDMGNAWFSSGFFMGKGFYAHMDEVTGNNLCNWNAPGGTDVVEGMLAIARHPAFMSIGGDAFITGAKDGSIIAGVSGAWHTESIQDAWGDSWAAAKLPTFTVGGQQVQQWMFGGSKLIGVNAFSENAGWAMELADWLTNYENQVKRFETRGQGPSNSRAAASPAVAADVALSAFLAQAAYSQPLRVNHGTFWGPANAMFENIALGNPDNIPLQQLLDNAVEGIVAPAG